MNDVFLQQEIPKHTSYIHELFDRYEQILSQHRLEDPDFYRMVEQQKNIQLQKAAETKVLVPSTVISRTENKISAPKLLESIYFKQKKQDQLKINIAASQKHIREHIATTQSVIVPRTQARNIKQPCSSIEKMTADRADKLSEQIKVWRSILPILIRRFSKIPDPRRAKSVKHQIVVVMLYGLLAFIFRSSSRREMNRELSGTVIFENLKKLFPELKSIPHADTLARVLEKSNINEISNIFMLLKQI